jgi:hypothetical protein
VITEAAMIVGLVYYVRVINGITDRVDLNLLSLSDKKSLLKKKGVDAKGKTVAPQPPKPTKTIEQLKKELDAAEKIAKQVSDQIKTGKEEAIPQENRDELKGIVKDINMLKLQIELYQEMQFDVRKNPCGELDNQKVEDGKMSGRPMLLEIEQKVSRVHKRLIYCRSEITIAF